MIEMQITHHRPADLFNRHESGVEAIIYREAPAPMRVRIFTHDGSRYDHPPFTSIEGFYNGRLYFARIGWFYSHRWLRRLAGDFAAQVQQLGQAEEVAG